MKKKFPKKAKLITDGGFYKIIDITSPPVMRISLPVMRKIRLSTPEILYDEIWNFELKFEFTRIYKSYAEYRQYDIIKVEAK